MRSRLLLPLASLLVLGACGTDISGPAPSLFSCALQDPLTLDVGQVATFQGAGNRGLCVDGTGSGAEFVYIPFHGGSGERAPMDVRVEIFGGVGPVVGPPDPAIVSWAPGSRSPDAAFHARLRLRERAELGRKIRTARGAGPAVRGARAAASVPEPGELVEYNVAISCTQADNRAGRVEYVSEHAVVVADTENPAGLTAADYQHFALTFDTLIHPVAVAHFGAPTDIDANGRSIIFFTRAVNALSAPTEGVYTAGFFWSGDLFPEEETPRAEACPAANQAEMFYMLAADPLGLAGPRFSTDFIRQTAPGVIAHEYQHLINASRRLWVNEASEFEEPWLNEGLSHAAEELVFYAASGLVPGSNLDYETLTGSDRRTAAFNRYMAGNLTNYSRYLQRPDTASLMGVDGLHTRGAAWSFLRYAADRSGVADDVFFMGMVNADESGLENLSRSLGEDPSEWIRDWTVSVYADDAVPVEPRYRQPSWNMRLIYPGTTLGRFPLEVLHLGSDGAHSLELDHGGAAYLRFGLTAGTRGAIHVEADGGVPPAALRGTVLRTR